MSTQQKPPIGFRFHPSAEELITHYLERRVLGIQDSPPIIPDVDIYQYDPEKLPDMFHRKSVLPPDTQLEKWWFFTPHTRSGSPRVPRSTPSGYWKKTCKEKKVKTKDTGRLIGIMEYLTFYKGRGKKAPKTNWIMHSYRLPTNLNGTHVLCCLKKKPDKKKADNLTEEDREALDFANSILLDQPVHD